MISPNGYFYGTQEQVEAAQSAITASWKVDMTDKAYEAGTECWDTVNEAVDGSGIWFTQKHPDDQFNEVARTVLDIQEGAGDLAWFPPEE